jgi:uncharacterized protein
VNRILADTNVYISAVVFGGKPALVLQIADSLGIELAVSAELEAEFRETLSGKFEWPADRVDEVCGRLWAQAHWVKPAPLSGVVRDSGDDHILAAIAAGVKLILTGDSDLLALEVFQGIHMVTPAAFLAAFTPGTS